MGTWGAKTFENDSALDWISEFEEEKDLTMIVVKFFEVYTDFNEKPEEPIDSDLASEVLAAAEIVSALLEKPSIELPTEIAKWLEKKKKKYDKALISMFNDIVKNADWGDDFGLLWKGYAKEEKWCFAIGCLSNYAVKCIEIVLEKSELKELWIESEDYEKWLDEVKNLKYRCKKHDEMSN